jgi:SAM-dependent methyltransferase
VINLILIALLLLTGCAHRTPQPEGKAAYEAFSTWRKVNAISDWGEAVQRYRAELQGRGVNDAHVERALHAIEAYGEAEGYDDVYSKAATFNTQPNQLLVEAVKNRSPGRALDVAMGQGRNAVYLATQGWEVTGFDVSAIGIRAAEQLANSRSVRIAAIHSSDTDFDFGKERWDLIALIYAIEKRSVYRIRSALKPGGLVVIEAGHKSASGAPFEYDSDELLAIFKGFRTIRYEEPTDRSDWGDEPIRLVRLIAEKPH